MNSEYKMRAARLGIDVPIDCYSKFTDDMDNILRLDHENMDTPEKRQVIFEEFMKSFSEKPLRRTGSIALPIPENIILAQIEHYIRYVEHQVHTKAAMNIQRHIRGVLLRNKQGVHNPNCDIGKKFILRLFED